MHFSLPNLFDSSYVDLNHFLSSLAHKHSWWGPLKLHLLERPPEIGNSLGTTKTAELNNVPHNIPII